MFRPSYYAFQEQDIRRMTSYTKEKGIFTILRNPMIKIHYKTFNIMYSLGIIKSNKETIGFNNCTLTTHPLLFLKSYFFVLFKEINVIEFHCDVCEVANYKHINFPINNTRKCYSFFLSFIMIFGDHPVYLTSVGLGDLCNLLMIALMYHRIFY